MQPVLPTETDLHELTNRRDEACVSIYLASSPLPKERDESRIALKSLVADAARELSARGVDREQAESAIAGLESLDDDSAFWAGQARGFALFAAPGDLRVFRLLGDVRRHVSVGDRFDVGILLRAISFDHSAFVLAVTEGSVHLYSLVDNEPLREIALPGLPDDLHSVLEYTTPADQAAPPRALGANGEKTEQRRYCRLVQDAVVEQVGAGSLPLILASTTELEPAYRSVNRYRGLADRAIKANPESLAPSQLAERARGILHELHVAEIRAWCERFELERSRDRATSDLGHVARAATAAAVDDLLFDMDADLSGTIDEDGVLRLSGDTGSEIAHYGILDEIAARVLRSGGTVRAARASDLPEGAAVAAILRYAF